MTYTVCSPRSGSQLLHKAFMYHPDLITYQEFLCDKMEGYDDILRKIIFDDYGITLPDEGRIIKKPWANVDYLKQIEHFYDFGKILYNHLTPQITEHLKTKKIINLVRKNVLEVIVSLKVAQRSDLWHIRGNHRKLDLSPIHLDPKLALRRFKWITEKRKVWQNEFTVYYEDLNNNWDQEIERIETFLGVSKIPLEKRFKKSITKPTEEMISNIDEIRKIPQLRKYLKGANVSSNYFSFQFL